MKRLWRHVHNKERFLDDRKPRPPLSLRPYARLKVPWTALLAAAEREQARYEHQKD